MPKISIIGAGSVGSTIAFLSAIKNLADLVLVDIVEGLPQGIALDILEATAGSGVNLRIVGSNSYEETKNSDIIVVTAGVPRKPGMSREDLVEINTKIVADVAKHSSAKSPNAIFIVLTNPLDSMSYVVKQVTGFHRKRIIGQAGILDTLRMKTFIAQKLDVDASSIEAQVLGSHGDEMVPIISKTEISGKPAEDILSKNVIGEIVERTKKGGAEIVNLLKTGSAYFAPATAVILMIEAILKNTKQIFPCSVYLEGEYGLKGLFIGVPVRLGSGGAEEIVELDLTLRERNALLASADAIRATQEVAKNFLARHSGI
ncbi:malate dehydrogenase [Patescibacteria group bacterium AH-259-L07]|nr:malate dehydrogenase [Patescibacteria group bacterium AH-259-L07]